MREFQPRIKHGCVTNWLVCEECCKCYEESVCQNSILFLSACVCLSKWVCFCFSAVLSVCMLDDVWSTLHDADEYTFGSSVHIGLDRAVSHCLCINMVSLSWLRRGFNVLGNEIALSSLLISKSLDSEIWFLLSLALTWNVEWFEVDFGLKWFLSWMGSKLDEIRLNYIFKYLDLNEWVHEESLTPLKI